MNCFPYAKPGCFLFVVVVVLFLTCLLGSTEIRVCIKHWVIRKCIRAPFCELSSRIFDLENVVSLRFKGVNWLELNSK